MSHIPVKHLVHHCSVSLGRLFCQGPLYRSRVERPPPPDICHDRARDQYGHKELILLDRLLQSLECVWSSFMDLKQHGAAGIDLTSGPLMFPFWSGSLATDREVTNHYFHKPAKEIFIYYCMDIHSHIHG